MNNQIVIKQKKSFKDYIPSWLKNINSMFYYFLFLVALGFLFFGTSIVWNYFTTPYSGDYTMQQYAFYTNGYDDWWHFFKTGEFVLYDTNTFLGVDNIGSNSFYYLFDPFFMPILICPRQLIPQFMVVLTVMKIAASGMTFFLYMRYLGASRRAAKITGLAYAFSGWMAWYLWFNHFTEVAIVLPLILLGIEMTIKEKQPWVLAGSLCLMGFTNFFFLVCFAICGFLYAMFRYFQTLKTRNLKNNLFVLLYGFLAFAIGILMPMMVVFPAAMHAISAPRAASSSYMNSMKEAFKGHNFVKIFKLLTSWKEIADTDQNKARVLFPFIDFAFPADTCRGTPLTVYNNDTYDNVAGSSYCFLPMMCLIVPAFIDSFSKKHFSVIAPLVFFVVALFTPACYYLFHGMTEGYSRWTLFVTTSILAYTGLYLDKIDKKPMRDLIIGYASMMVMMAVAGICAYHITTKYKDSFEPRIPIWLAMVIEGAYLLVYIIVIILIRYYKKPKFYGVFTGFIAVEVALMGAFVIAGHGVEDYYYTNKGFIKNDALHSVVSKVTKDDPSYYRSFSSLASQDADNDGMRNDYNGFNFFHSVYNFNTADICNWSSITGGTAPNSWSGNYIQKHVNLDTVLGVKYYYVEDDYYYYQNRKEASSEDFKYNVPFDYIDMTDAYPSNGEFRVYKNNNYIDFALTYDNVVSVVRDNTYSSDMYDLYTATNGKNVLLNEEMYLESALFNFTDEKSKPHYEELFANAGISISKPHNYETTDFYKTITPKKVAYPGSTKKEGKASTSADLTYYDIRSAGKESLSLSAKDYLTLCNPENTTFKQYYNISETAEDGISQFQRWVSVLEADGECFPDYDPRGNIFYVTAKFTDRYDVDIYFVDVNNEIVTYDNHNDGYFNGSRTGKEYRGFYITPTYGVDESGNTVILKDAPKIKKIITVARNSKIQKHDEYKVYIDTYTKYEKKMNALKEYVVTDVKSSANTYKFKTNFDKPRLVVTRLAYEDGFKLKMTDANGNKQNVEVFNAQGGFVSFISGTGECSYKLEFVTPNLAIGSLMSSISTFLFLSSFAAYYFFEIRRQDKEKELMLSL